MLSLELRSVLGDRVHGERAARHVRVLPVIALAVVLAAFIACVSFGVDRQVTLHLSSAGYVIVGVVLAIAAWTAGRNFASDSGAQTAWSDFSRMRHDAPAKRFARGMLFVGTTAVLCATAAWYFLSVLVPYLPGKADRSMAVIEHLYSVGARGCLCNTYAVVVLESGDRAKFCYERGRFARHRVSSEPLSTGDHVVVEISNTAIGSAVQSITPTLR